MRCMLARSAMVTRRRPRALRSTVVLLASLSAGACAAPDFRGSPVAFSCEEDHRCPEGYRCTADLCVRNDLPALPDVLDRSAEPFAPELHLDPDRSGSFLCWTRSEERGQEHGAVYGAFISNDGTITTRRKLINLDTRNATYIATCAPVPGTDGAVLVTVLTRRAAQNTLALYVWRPSSPRGVDGPADGVAQPFFTENAVEPSDIPLVSMRSAQVGDEVQFLWQQQSRPGGGLMTPTQFVRYRVSARELMSNRPTSNPLLETPLNISIVGIATAMTCDRNRNCFGTAMGGPNTWMMNLPASAPATQTVIPYGLLPSHEGARVGTFGQALAMRESELALAFHDPSENENQRTGYRVAWARADVLTAQLGPRLPFEQIDTQQPQGFTDGSSLFVLGATPVDRDGHTRFSLYRLPWGTTNPSATWETVHTIDRELLGNRPVTATAARVRTDNSGFDVAWVESYPPDRVGARGARYVLYAQRRNFR